MARNKPTASLAWKKKGSRDSGVIGRETPHCRSLLVPHVRQYEWVCSPLSLSILTANSICIVIILYEVAMRRPGHQAMLINWGAGGL